MLLTPVQSPLRVGSAVYVDAVNGTAGGARGRADKPFLTLAAALAAAQAGDTIHVLSGTFNERNLLKDGVNWHWYPGTGVDYTGAADGGIFDNSSTGVAGAITCRIGGSGVFKNRSTHAAPTRAYVLVQNNVASDISFECDRMVEQVSNAGEAGGIRHVGGTLVVRVNEIVTHLNTDFTAGTVVCGVWWSDGEMRLTFGRIIVNGDFNVGIYASTRTNESSIADGVWAAGDLWVRGDYISATGENGYGFYTVDNGDPAPAPTNGRLWVTIDELKCAGAAGFPFAHYGFKGYYTIKKINGDEGAGGTIALVQGGSVWLDCQKLSGGGDLLYIAVGTAVINLGNMEDPSNNATALVRVAGGTLTLNCPKAIGGTGADGLVNNGGTVRFCGYINTAAAATKRPVVISGSPVETVLVNTTLVANAARESIFASTAKNVKVYPTVVSNKAKHANVTLTVGTETTDADVT